VHSKISESCRDTGDHLEGAEIDGCHGVAMLRRSSSDQQVGEGDGHALGALLALDLPGALA
jgi:hypothetical protein